MITLTLTNRQFDYLQQAVANDIDDLEDFAGCGFPVDMTQAREVQALLSKVEQEQAIPF